ncbi:MAG: hypothetical protein AB3N16_11075, partial [Flavobacteriaceae bacterium]
MVNTLLKNIDKRGFKIFTSPAIALNRKVYDPNFTQQEKKQLRTIFRLVFNEYLLDFFKWHPEQEVREAIAKIEHWVFLDRRLPLETYVGKHFMPLMKKAPAFKHLVSQTDLRKLPDVSVSDLLQLEVPINKHPFFHGESEEVVDTPQPEGPEADTGESDTTDGGGTLPDKPLPPKPPTPNRETGSDLNTFVADLSGLKGLERTHFLSRHKGQLMDKKNAKEVFDKDIQEPKLNKINYSKGLLELTQNDKELTTQLYKMPRMTSLKELARNKGIDWKKVVKKGAGGQHKGEQLEKTLA